MNNAVEQRLRFIEFLLIHYNLVGRDELTEYFGISKPQATRDFGSYRELAPDNMLLNPTSKKYIKTDTFKRVYQ